jgi:pimeloyl-ACP methyl ester carboxylesterase
MFTQVNDCNVHYEVSGEGKPLILVHGTGADAQSFEDMIPILSKDFKVYAYDMRGFGETIRPTQVPLSDTLWADDLAGLMGELGVEQAALAGWSLGGIVAMEFALRYPQMVSHLILIGSGSPLPTSTPMDRSGFETRRKLAEEGASIEEIVEKTFEFSKGAYSPHVVQNKPEALEKLRQTLLRNDPKSYADVIKATRSDFGPKLGEIGHPTLIIVGEDDTRTPVEMSEGLNKAIPNSYMKVIENCGHFYGFEQPEETCRVMMNFLKRF